MLVKVTTLGSGGHEVKKVAVETLKEDFDKMRYSIFVNGTLVHTYSDLLAECQKVEEPEVLRLPIIVGGGMDVKREGDKIVITIDLEKNPPLSSTGKSKLLFSTGGFIPIDLEGTKINLMVIKKA